MRGTRRVRVGGPTDRGRRRAQRDAGVTAVEFALVAPLAFLLLMGVVVTGIVVTNQVALTNVVRDGARAAAVCGSNPTGTTTLPDGSTQCSDTNLTAYLLTLVNNAHGGVPAPTVTVYDAGHNALGSSLALCQKGYTVEVSASYAQPLYVPMLGHFLGDAGGNTRAIKARADATCEQ